jgi:hypothetical protein
MRHTRAIRAGGVRHHHDFSRRTFPIWAVKFWRNRRRSVCVLCDRGFAWAPSRRDRQALDRRLKSRPRVRRLEALASYVEAAGPRSHRRCDNLHTVGILHRHLTRMPMLQTRQRSMDGGVIIIRSLFLLLWPRWPQPPAPSSTA